MATRFKIGPRNDEVKTYTIRDAPIGVWLAEIGVDDFNPHIKGVHQTDKVVILRSKLGAEVSGVDEAWLSNTRFRVMSETITITNEKEHEDESHV